MTNLGALSTVAGNRNSLDMRKRRGLPKAACDRVIQAPDYSGMTEHQIQVALFRAFKQRRMPFAVMFAIPNGGERRDAASGRQLKLEGVTAGVPDIFCASGIPEQCFLIELKTESGTLSPAQKKFHATLVAAGVEVVVCRGFLAAVHTLEERGIIRLPDTSKAHDTTKKTRKDAPDCGRKRPF